MAVKYSIRSLLALTAVAVLVVGCQTRLNSNIVALESDIRNLESSFHSSLPDDWQDSEVRITSFETSALVADLLTFSREVNCEYSIETNLLRTELAHHKIKLKAGEDYVDVPLRLPIKRRAAVAVDAFGYRLNDQFHAK